MTIVSIIATLTLRASMLLEDLFLLIVRVTKTHGLKLKTSTKSNGIQILVQ